MRSQPISLGGLDQGAEAAEDETTKASRGMGNEKGVFPPQPTRGSGERRKLPQRGPS